MSLFGKKGLSESDIDEKRKNVTGYFSVFKHGEMPEDDGKPLEKTSGNGKIIAIIATVGGIVWFILNKS